MVGAKGRQRIVRDGSELEVLRRNSKLTACPHCGQIGTLNAHGWLRGYGAKGSARVERGRRFYCSDRFRRAGCGRTFSMLLASFLGGFVVVTETLWSFVTGVLRGLSRKAAWAQAAGTFFAGSTGYRLWRRIQLAQVALRARLCEVSPPPACEDAVPLAQLVQHLRAVAAAEERECPFAVFQYRFQQHLLG